MNVSSNAQNADQNQRITTYTKPVTLTIAGFDPSGGAGVTADIKTFTAFECFATAAITSLTFQNTTGVFGATHQTAETVRNQIIPIVEDFPIGCVKTGMLPTREIISEVANLLREYNLPNPVIDPVIRSSSGYDLIDDQALNALKSELFPLARLITPNIPEAERITGLLIANEDDMRHAAKVLRAMGVQAVLIKGGHLEGEATDILHDQDTITVFREERINTKSTHGTGCTLASAIAACLAHGIKLEPAVALAKRYVTNAIYHAPGIGHGYGPLEHSVPTGLKGTS